MTAARIAKDHLKAFVERIERLEEEKKTIADDIRDVYAEAKANGFDTKALKVRPSPSCPPWPSRRRVRQHSTNSRHQLLGP